MRRGVRFVPTDPTTLCSGYLAGVSGTALGAQLGVSKHTVYRLLKSQGVSLRPSGRRKLDLNPLAIRDLYAQGRTINAIAKLYACQRQTITRILKEEGVIAEGGLQITSSAAEADGALASD